MKFLTIINSAFGVGTALVLARILPRKIGHLIAARIGSWMADQKNSPQTKGLRSNQWVVSGMQLSGEELDNRVKEVFVLTGKCLFDFYHYLYQPAKINEFVELNPIIDEYFDTNKNNNSKKNALFVATHLSNFDIMGQALGLNGYRFQILSYPNPGSGYRWQNAIRKNSGHLITPTSVESLHQARIRLQEGQNVLTGLDRPISSGKYRPKFFNQPASVPVAYTRLALQTNTPVIVVSAITKPDGNYRLFISEPIKMLPLRDPYKETIRNTEAVLEVAEEIISKYPEQWSMVYPVWPELIDKNIP